MALIAAISSLYVSRRSTIFRTTSLNRSASFISRRCEPERLFVQIPKQVERLDGVGAAQRPLQQTPEVLAAVRVNLPVHVLVGVVDKPVDVVGSTGSGSLLLLSDSYQRGFG